MDKRNYYGNNSRPNNARQGATKHRRKRRVAKRFLVFVISLLLIAAAVVFIIATSDTKPGAPRPGRTAEAPRTTVGPNGEVIELSPTPEPTPTPTPTPPPPVAVAATKPDVLGVQSELNVDGRDVDSYRREGEVFFGEGSEYTGLPGVTTFRGNTFRDTTSYGTAGVTQKKLEIVWEVPTASIRKGSGSGAWTGAGWTGQPIIVQWPEATRKVMNIVDAKKSKKDLVEVIYAIEDGQVYFLDLADGKKTRSTLNMGITFKGSGGIDPRGVPLLYIGAGDSTPSGNGLKAKQQGFYIVSLLDTKTLHEFGTNPDSFSQRSWHAYDGAAAIDAATDTLIEQGENGIIYTMKLNTKYDEAAGTLSIDPSEKVKMRYTTKRARDGMKNNTYWLGMEDSAVYYRDHMYVADNCGTLICVNLNTMEVVWAADTLDDTNGSPVLELENGHPYIYISTSLHWTKDKSDQGTIPIWKFDALTGEAVWHYDYKCYTVTDVSGGVQSTALVGKGPLSDLVFFSVARTPSKSSGVLVALNKKTGKPAWEFPMKNYAWSSPIAIYSDDGKGYIVQCDSIGQMILLDGLTGEKLDVLQLAEANIEATPAAFNDMIVVGSRGQRIYGIKIK